MATGTTGFENFFVSGSSGGSGTDSFERFNPDRYDPTGFIGGDFDIGTNLIYDLVGKNKKDRPPSWVQDAQGNWHFRGGGGVVPLPPSTIPGAGGPPSVQYQQSADQLRIINDLLPYYARSIAGQLIPQEQAKLAAAQVTSPGMAELMTKLYAQYGPQLNEIGNQIALQNAMASAQRDTDVLAGPGQDLIRQALEAAKLYDPEFFKTRELTADRTADLLRSVNLGSGLSETERREVEQGLAREGQARGTAGAPSQTETVSNAMQYGQAGRNRELQSQSALAQAISASTQFLPASRSGVDVFQVATGKPSGANTGENKFTGVQMPGQEAYGLAGQLFGNIGQSQRQQADIKATANLNEKDWLDQFSQFSGALGNLGGIIGGAAAFCWTAREVYGAKDVRWQIFRQWMLNHAPKWLLRLYIKHGQRLAWWLHDKPKLKNVIKHFMNKAIERNYGWNT